jgi:predicted kinase
VVTGLPATGKSTLARELARWLQAPLLGKDMIKEPLLDALGAGDEAHSRLLSRASFAILFAIARELLACNARVIVEGNFRPGEHERPLLQALPPGSEPAGAFVQVLCRVEVSERIARLKRRATDPGRHAGHRDAIRVAAADSGGFLDLPGRRIEFDSHRGAPSAEALAEFLLADVNLRTV